jgi:hypothetical protein
LVLRGLAEDDGLAAEEWKRRLLECRYCEARMLYFLGKDLSRWLNQCEEFAQRNRILQESGVTRDSFADILVKDPLPAIAEKMRRWGIADCAPVFRHALGLSILFETMPPREVLSDEFLCHHRRYATALFDVSHEGTKFATIQRSEIHFELYASAEYVKLLEAQWASDE